MTTGDLLFCSGVLMIAGAMRLRWTPLAEDAEAYKLGYRMVSFGLAQILLALVIR